MTTLAEFDFDDARDRLLDAAAEIVRSVDDLTIAVLTVEANESRRGRQLLREALDLLTNADTRVDLRDWIRTARTVVPPLDQPLPTTEELVGRLHPEPPLPTIPKDEDHEPLFPRRDTDE